MSFEAQLLKQILMELKDVTFRLQTATEILKQLHQELIKQNEKKPDDHP